MAWGSVNGRTVTLRTEVLRDAIHLATAVNVGADRFLTDNRKDLPASIDGLEITYPESLIRTQ